MSDSYEVDQRVQACFEGQMQRSCGTCSAFRKGCCFGEKFDDNDRECSECLHSNACRASCVNRVSYQTRSNVVVRGQPIIEPAYRPATPLQSTYSHPGTYSQPYPTSQTTVQENRISQQYMAPPTNLIHINSENYGPALGQLLKNMAWHAAEGLFESIVRFFKTHDWQ